MTDLVHIVGFVATPPKHFLAGDGLPVTTFRFASTARRFDRGKNEWVDGDTNWFSVSVFRQFAINVAGSISKGDRLIVSGRLRVREWEAGEKKGINVEIDADAIGHDLVWGTTSFTRSIASSHARQDAPQPNPEGASPSPDEFPSAVAPSAAPPSESSAASSAEPTLISEADAEALATPF